MDARLLTPCIGWENDRCVNDRHINAVSKIAEVAQRFMGCGGRSGCQRFGVGGIGRHCQHVGHPQHLTDPPQYSETREKIMESELFVAVALSTNHPFNAITHY